MSGRFIPYNHSGQAHPRGRSTASNITQSKKPKQTRHAHTDEEWEAIREVVLRIYIEEKNTIDELVRVLQVEHKFVVSKRKLHEWMRTQGISKNESKEKMGVLFAKREDRWRSQGKKTVIFKDGRVICDYKLDRWGAKHAATFDAPSHLAAATPEGYTIETPRPTISYGETDSNSHEALHNLFVAERPVHVTFGAVLDDLDSHHSDSHPHQIGILGLRMISDISNNSNLPMLLRRSLSLATDLISAMLVPPMHGNSCYVSARPTPNTRVPKVNISFTGCPVIAVNPFLESQIVTILQRSKICVQLLQLRPSDCELWHREWYAMTAEERSVAENLCTGFFGSLSSFDPAIAYMHVTVLLESPDRLIDTVITRFSLGMDMRPTSVCKSCERRVFTADSLSGKTAVKLNVPLQSAWQRGWEPERFETVEAVAPSRWEDYVHALRGWFVKLPLFHTLLGCSDIKEEEDVWDPMDSNNPLAVFQPREMNVPVWCCAFNHVGYVCQCDPWDSGVFNVNPDEGEIVDLNPVELVNESWDPNDSLPRMMEMGALAIPEEELIEFESHWYAST